MAKHIPPSTEVREEALRRARRMAEGLYPHQIEGIAFLLARRRAILADDMGLGKTRQSVVALTESEPVGPYLVVCPASVKRNWAREILIVKPDAKPTIVGPGMPPDLGWKDWVIINYDILGKHADALKLHGWSGMVFDEAHYLKNYRSKRNQLSNKLIKSVNTDPMIHALTGTPLTSRPRDLFPLLQLVQHPMGKSFLTFARRYCAAYKGEYGWVTDGASNLGELAVQLHGIMIRRNKDEVLDLPPKFRTWLEVDVPPGTAREIRGFMHALMRLSLKNREQGSSTEKLTEEELQARRRRQGVLLGGLSTARRKLATAKVRSTWNFVDGVIEQGEKAIIFSCYKEAVLRLREHYEEIGVAIEGDTPPAQRQDIADQFQQDEDVRVLIANIQAGGTGLNLTAGRQVVFNDLDWVPANHWQAEDRACRIGQTQSVNVTYMIGADTIDEFVRSVLISKAHMVDQLVEGKALEEDVNADVLGELKSIMRTIGPSLGNLPEDEFNEQRVVALLKQATETFEDQNSDLLNQARRQQVPYSAEALSALAKVLSGPEKDIYQVESSKKDKFYRLEVVGPDVICNCPGFDFRGACKHSRALKESLVAGDSLPEGFEPVAD
ncbi:MAG: DEAD/DEAH box helicase [Planctomycetota bacterium]|jgi:SWI/SNF-related matrix-associated actin-dependent regulator 1 of chromatin subfamily A|nr:DEAD/DEAH box helicase [Planctomycetota bacterium]MDP7254262.1 DEAD/DEAH box helicase [Planctomycetota bacterium]